MLMILLGMITVAKFQHKLKRYFPMLVTLLGMLMEVKHVQ